MQLVPVYVVRLTSRQSEEVIAFWAEVCSALSAVSILLVQIIVGMGDGLWTTTWFLDSVS